MLWVETIQSGLLDIHPPEDASRLIPRWPLAQLGLLTAGNVYVAATHDDLIKLARRAFEILR